MHFPVSLQVVKYFTVYWLNFNQIKQTGKASEENYIRREKPNQSILPTNIL